MVAPIDKLSLLVAILLAGIFLHERLSIVQWAGAFFMVLGVLLVGMK